MFRRKVTDESRNRVHQNKQRRNRSGLADGRPSTKQQKRREKDSTASAGEARQKSEACANTDRHWTRRRPNVWRVALARKQTHRREKQHQSNQDSPDRSRRLQVTAEIRGWN